MRQLIKYWATMTVMLFLLPLSCELQAEELVISGSNCPPYEFEKPEEGLRGSDLEVIEAAFARVGVTTRFKFLPWKRALEMTINGNFPAVMTCGITEGRAKVLTFSDPLSHATSGFFIRRDYEGPKPKTIEEAQGLRIGAILGWLHVKELQKTGVDVKTYRTEDIALRDLVKGEFDYLYTDKETTGFKAKQLGLSENLGFVTVLQRDYYLCFSRKWDNVEDLVIRFNDALKQVKQDGTFERIHSRYR